LSHSAIRLLALDLDGTVLDSQSKVPEANRAAIAEAIAAGVEVAIATGRRYDFARPIVESLPPPLTLILSNGAIVKNMDGTTLMRRLLTAAAARQVLSLASAHRARAALIFDRPREGQVVFEAIDWKDRRHRKFVEANRPFVSEVSPLEDALTEDPVQIMFSGPCAPMRELIDLLQPPDPGRSNGNAYSVALTEYARLDLSLVDVLQGGCSKGAALQAWAARQGIARHEVMAIGDNMNDVEMLEFAGVPVVMGNATDALKSRGWAETTSNDEAGAARAIATFILQRAS
jgi:Cof subfamily protein (haloacid dehalogenase superfamily)